MKPSCRLLCPCVAALALLGCDRPDTPRASTRSASAATSTSRPASDPLPPVIRVGVRGCTVDDAEFDGVTLEWQGRAAAAIASKPHVAGERVAIDAARNARIPNVEAVLVALANAKATSALIRTPTVNGARGELTVTLNEDTIPACSVVVKAEPRFTFAVWRAGGGEEQVIARGKPGFDFRGAADALRRRAARCDSLVWVLAEEGSFPWSLLFNLATLATSDDAGPPLHPTELVLLTHAVARGERVPSGS